VKKGKPWAQEHMADMYRDGDGVKQSYEMARRLYELAAQQGVASAMYSLGYMYEKGQGVEQSYERAKEYYEQAADLGYPEAQSNLGNMYYKGEGIEKDLKKAKDLWELAGNQKHVNAQCNLADMYEKGEGMPISLKKATEWYSKAADQGDDLAIKHLARLNKLDDVTSTSSASSSLDDVLVCSTCGSPAPVSSKFKNCPCGSARYCNKTCQKKHWKEHRNKCKRLLKDRKQKKKT
jgi:TPR repeat protein